MYMYRISALVNQIRKMPPVLFDPLLKARVDRPIAFDFVNQMTYSFKDNYIIKHPFFGLSQKSIYYLENDITDMTLEPISHVLIFLTRIKQLKVLSFITNFEHLVHVGVVWFRYSHHHKLIWFMTTTNLLCHCRLLESPDCNQHDSGYLKAFVDSTNLKGYFLTAQNELQIQTYRNDIKHIGSVSNMPNVQDFAVDANHLYYVSEGQLIYKDVTTDASVVKLGDRQNFRRLDLYRIASLCALSTVITMQDAYALQTWFNQITNALVQPPIRIV
ncbi:hypothetical protein RF11_11385 [Thelohanellus kitauei]|uniref:CRIB domain-containing protein n=1 Tax=Thelohanellus kitauei TaxID=669202 RepID=A0A0C2NL14_THEKT|nr:hypothetical protein RF11_11385 [Thelohanellus kitauei]